MAKKQKSSDVNVTAFEILKAVTGETTTVSHKGKSQKPEKNPAAVALGRLGGLKGGKARAKSLSGKRKTEIAQNAAKARWAKE